ncbi:MAG TPA: SBBP repeat-containing protein [Bryobacteraceae bacterium]|nr:SBBP repeat-containing protein [Bryobacteraceae bacterium]
MKPSFFVTLICVASGVLAAAPHQAARSLATAPLRFEPADSGAGGRFLARGARFRFEASKNQALLAAGDKVVRLEFAGAARDARLEGDDPLRSKTGLFLGNDRRNWRSAIPNFGRLQVHGLYSGIDLVYYGKAGEIEYDLNVKPGADPRQICLRIRGEQVRLDHDGNLIAALIQERPVAYQLDQNGTRTPVESRYRRNRDGSFGFALGPYDRARALVIDPVLTVSAYLSGSKQDIAFAIGHDAQGFEYVAGTTDSADFSVTSDARQGTLASGATNLFIAKIDPTAPAGSQVLYVTYLGGSKVETFGGMAVGPRGDVYLTGTTTSANFPAVNAFESNPIVVPDAFVAWIDSNSNLAYSTYLGGSNPDGGTAIAVDSQGRMWIAGYTQSSDFINGGNGAQNANAGSQDAFIVGVDGNQAGPNSLIYASYFGGAGWDTGRGIAVAADGTVWVAGGTYSFDLPIIGSGYQPSYRGGGDAFVAHINPVFGVDGLLYSSYLGGAGLDEARSLLLDPSGAVIVSGYTVSPNFPTTTGALQPKFGGNTDIFVSILNPNRNLQLVYSTYFGGSGADVAFDLKRDAAGVLYLAGFTQSPGLPNNGGSLQPKYDGGMDAFVLKFNPARAGADGLDYFSYLGSDGLQIAYGVDFDASGNLYLAGSTSGPIFDAFGGAGKPTDSGNTDAFVAGFSACTFAISFGSEQFARQGGSDTVQVTGQQPDCVWTASSSLDWVTLSPTSGSGNGAVQITVAPNASGAPRQGVITIAGVQFLVGQD